MVQDHTVQTIGIDIGGTKIAAGLVDASGRVEAFRVRPTPRGSAHATLDAVVEFVLELDEAGGPCPAGPVGVAVPELVDTTGRIASRHTLDWDEQDLREALGPRPLCVETDVHAAAFGEARHGRARDIGTLVYVSLGTGISVSVLVDGAPLRGRNGFTGIVGSAPLVTRCANCDDLAAAALEDFASGAGLFARYTQSGRTAAEARDVFDAAVAGHDQFARKIVHQSAEAIGATIGQLINLIDPDLVCIGGGLSRAPNQYWELMITSARSHTWLAAHLPPIVRTSLGERVGVVGVASRAAELAR